MRRKPVIQRPISGARPRDLASPPSIKVPTTPATQGDAIEPWITSGGQTFYYSGWEFPDDPPLPGLEEPQYGAVQLLAHQYVPKGRAGWIKQIAVAPCAPPILVDPWRGWDATFNWFSNDSPTPFQTQVRAPAQAGLWETPLAWEGYYAPIPEGGGFKRPLWQWSLSAIPGSLANYRASRNLPPFDVTNVNSWWLVPDIAVPDYVYRGGIPGVQLQGNLPPQRMQAMPSDPLLVHIQVPENHTICLWAKWTQFPYYFPRAYQPNGPINPWGNEIPPTFVLQPSIGRLVGYMQAASRDASAINASHGWQG
jgi:hypothetical protein